LQLFLRWMRLCLRTFQRNQTSKIKMEPRVGSCNRNTPLGLGMGKPKREEIGCGTKNETILRNDETSLNR
jgi:hypothetical protein